VGVIHNGVDVSQMMSGDREIGRKEIGAEPADFVIGSVGRLAPVKNHQLLLRAVRGMSNQKRHKVVLIGEGPERHRLEDLTAQLGLGAQVRLLGHREDIPDLLAAMDVFVLPSLSEGMSHALLEAMAAARPVIASAVRGNSETLSSPDQGLLFASGDESALRALLERLASNPEVRTRIGIAAQSRVRRDFNIQTMVRNYARLYEEALCPREERLRSDHPQDRLLVP
jgi:glycosyltransferase involved in cell wall biosynthesis